MTTVIRTEAPHFCTIHVWHGEDWYDAIPQMLDPNDGEPFDITAVVMRLTLRPAFNHATMFHELTSSGAAGIVKEDAAQGLAAIFLPQATVEANLPLTTTQTPWEHFMRLTWTDPDLGSVTKHLWTGPLIVHPAKATDPA